MKTTSLFLLFMFCAIAMFSQSVDLNGCYADDDDYLVVDLATVSKTQIDLKPGKTVKLKLINALPSGKYSITYKSDKYVMSQSNVPSADIMGILSGYMGGIMERDRAGNTVAETEFINLMSIMTNEQMELENALSMATTEAEVFAVVQTIALSKSNVMKRKDRIGKVASKSLLQDFDDLFNYYDDMLATTVKTYDNQILEISGDKKYEIIITRIDEENPYIYDTLYLDGTPVADLDELEEEDYSEDEEYFDEEEEEAEDDDYLSNKNIVIDDEDEIDEDVKSKVYRIIRKPNAKVWSIEVLPQVPGFFSMTYGVSFASPLFTQNEVYYCNPDMSGGYVITAENPDAWTDLDYLPGIFLNYYRNEFSSINGFSAFNPSIGIGIRSESPAVFLGFNFSFKQTANIHLGITAYQGTKLLNKYNPGDVLLEHIEKEDLVDKTFLFNPTISISFKFNDFVVPAAEEEEEEEEDYWY